MGLGAAGLVRSRLGSHRSPGSKAAWKRGRDAAERFHDAYRGHVGVKETVDIRKMFD